MMKPGALVTLRDDRGYEYTVMDGEKISPGELMVYLGRRCARCEGRFRHFFLVRNRVFGFYAHLSWADEATKSLDKKC